MAPFMKFFTLATLVTSTALAITATKVSSATAATINRTTVSNFDLRRYLGTWHEIARFDNRFERNLTNVTARYSTLPDGHIEVQNRGYNTKEQRWEVATGKAKRTSVAGRLKVSFFWFFYAPYNVMAVGDGGGEEPYEWALVGSKSDKYLWILSRTDTLDLRVKRKILTIAEARGYDTSQFIFRKQQPAAAFNRRDVAKVVSSSGAHNRLANNFAVRFFVDNVTYIFDLAYYRIITSDAYHTLTSGTITDELNSLLP